MIRLARISLIAVLLLLAFFSLPFWFLAPQVANEGSSERQNVLEYEGVNQQTQGEAPASRRYNLFLTDMELPAMTLVDAGWVTGIGALQKFMHPPAILRWDPARASVDWRLESGSLIGAYADAACRIYLVEGDKLTILNEQTGEVLKRNHLKDMPASGPNAGHMVPIGRKGNQLYLRNHAMRDNLFVYDLLADTFIEERWNLCESGYPFESVYLQQENAFVTFCIDFSYGAQGVLTRLSVESGTSASAEIPTLGADEYMTGNGFALGLDHRAYVVDSDAGALVEIDLYSMQVLDKVNYRRAGKESGWPHQSVPWLLELAASPARAKRWMSRPAVSPDGRYLVVDGGFGIGGGKTTTVWLIDLKSLGRVHEIVLPRSPEAFHFASDSLLYILLQTELPGGSQVMVFDAGSRQSLTLDVPTSGRVLQFLP